ncbi:MAG: hypothetical protein M1505_00615 [Patescibacteria group bacterium]|nr:hypothetical protein [Patescibacteria group bacterium]
MPAIQKIDNASTVNRIARQSVGMPGQNSVGFTSFNTFYHFTKNQSARNFGRLFFYKLLDNVQSFGFRKGVQFCDLRFNTQHLLVLNIGGLAGIQKEFLR